jgi:hypothetical protein
VLPRVRARLNAPLSYCASPRRRHAALSSVDGHTRPRPSPASRATFPREEMDALAPDGDLATRPGAVLSPAARSALAATIPAVIVLVGALALAGCGRSQEDDSLPPLTPEPGLSLPAADSPPVSVETNPPASRSGLRASYPARLVLMRFLRGVGAGDRRACGLLSPSYARTAFAAAGGCQKWIGAIPTRLTPDELHQLRTVQVLGATPGPRRGQYTVRPADLRWAARAEVPKDVVAQQYVLARAGGRWIVVA